MSSNLALYENKDIRQGHIDNSLFSEKNFFHYMKVAETLSKSSLVPKAMTGKPADILVAMEHGLQLGIPMMQAIQDIAVINGKPSMYGDGLLAVVQGHKDYEWIEEKVINEVATCIIKRKNHEQHSVTFSKEDAKKAGLWGRPGPWSQYPERMLKMRARGFCIRDIFSDALRGIKTEEEVNDYPVLNKKEKSKEVLNDLLDINNKKDEKNVIDSVVLSSLEQHEEINNLIIEKNFSESRLKSAFRHYKVNEMCDMTSEQASDFINILKKEP